MRSRRMVLCAVTLVTVACGLALSGSAAAPAMLISYAWSGADPSDAFHAHCNWHPAPECGLTGDYPDGLDDDATFPTNGGTAWACDLTIEKDVNFGSVGAAPTLDVQKLVIVVGSASDTIITIGGGAKITITNP